MSDYPSDAELEQIRTAETDPRSWFAFICATGHFWPDWGWRVEEADEDGKPVTRYLISTGGWSGNEDILAAMRDNFILWHQTWRVHRAGGHYEFEVAA